VSVPKQGQGDATADWRGEKGSIAKNVLNLCTLRLLQIQPVELGDDGE